MSAATTISPSSAAAAASSGGAGDVFRRGTDLLGRDDDDDESGSSLHDRPLVRECLMHLNNRAVRFLKIGHRRESVRAFQQAFVIMQRGQATQAMLDELVNAAKPERWNDLQDKSNADAPSVTGCRHDPIDVLATIDAGADNCLLIEPGSDINLIKPIIIFNYGVCHCNIARLNVTRPDLPKLGSLCWTIYKYAETSLPPVDAVDSRAEYLVLALYVYRKLFNWTSHLGLPIAELYGRSIEAVVDEIRNLER